MFGMGFMEILLIAVVAIIALGPDKLPGAMVEIAKFIKKFKSGIEDAKSTLDNELNISEMKEEAAKYKAQIENAKNTLNVKENMNLDLDNILSDDNEPSKPKIEEPKIEAKEDEKKEQVSLKESKKNKKKENSDKFKVNFDEEVKEEK